MRLTLIHPAIGRRPGVNYMRTWQMEPLPNMTGTDAAHMPRGALQKGGHRAAATGDYEAWSPN